MTRLPSCPPGPTLSMPAQMQPQPVVTLSLQCLPMHQHFHMQLQNQSRLSPASPAHAQTPPLHTVPDLTNSSLPQHPAKQHSDFYMVHGTDVNSEVDALDPSIMDFTWQGNYVNNRLILKYWKPQNVCLFLSWYLAQFSSSDFRKPVGGDEGWQL